MFLASQKASGLITGIDIRVDGGFLSQTIYAPKEVYRGQKIARTPSIARRVHFDDADLSWKRL